MDYYMIIGVTIKVYLVNCVYYNQFIMKLYKLTIYYISFYSFY